MNLPVTAGQLEMIALSLLGIFILVGAIPSLIAGIAELIAPRTFDPFAGGFGPTGYRGSKVIEVVGAAFRVVVGTWLVFGSRDFAAFLNRLRSRD